MTLEERRYANYVRAYNKKAAELAEYGASMSSPMYTKGQYKDIYRSVAPVYEKSKNIPKILVERQAREYSPAQARARAKAIRESGVKIERGYAKFKYKEGVNKDFDEALSKRYAEMKATGQYTSRQMREMLGVEFFYSDEDESED